jgi:hypothetical protein
LLNFPKIIKPADWGLGFKSRYNSRFPRYMRAFQACHAPQIEHITVELCGTSGSEFWAVAGGWDLDLWLREKELSSPGLREVSCFSCLG